MPLTDEQQAVVEHLGSTSTDLLVQAYAGTGKTTTGEQSFIPIPQYKIAYIVFNKRNAVEADQRMPDHVEARTFNSYGHRAWAAAIGKRRMELNADKMFGLQKDMELPPGLSKLCGILKANGMVSPSSKRGKPLVEWSEYVIDELIFDHDLEFGFDGEITDTEQIAKLADQLMAASVHQAYNGVIDFDDQVYMSACFGGVFEKSDIVFVDEAQDTSPVQMRLVEKLRAEKTVAVGDEYQAIYGFRGAGVDSMDRYRNDLQPDELTLSLCFRCGTDVIREAQRYVPGIQPAPGMPSGSVAEGGVYSPSMFQPGDTILCRNTKPLFKLAHTLIQAGIGCHILGGDIGAGLIKLIKKFGEDHTPLSSIVAKLENHTAERADRLMARKRITAAQMEWEKFHSIEALVDGLQGTSLTRRHLTEFIAKLFSDKSGTITLSTIHKSKGLEWPRVHLLDPQLMPSKWAHHDWQIQQENNLAYVAITRACADKRRGWEGKLTYIQSPED